MRGLRSGVTVGKSMRTLSLLQCLALLGLAGGQAPPPCRTPETEADGTGPGAKARDRINKNIDAK